MKKENQEIIDKLKRQYRNDVDALEEIERRAIDIEYVEKKEESGDYKGQPSHGIVLELEATLHDWY